MSLYDRLRKIQTTNPYFSKDLAKARQANKFIGSGSAASSTHRYMSAAGDLANCGTYCEEDCIFVSVEGARKGRIPLDREEVGRAISAGATIIADNAYDRSRPYNIGERELLQVLTAAGYVEEHPGRWKPSSPVLDVSNAGLLEACFKACRPEDQIPHGLYCYSIQEGPCEENGFRLRTRACPYWGIDPQKREELGEQSAGYCAYLRRGDWQTSGSLWDQVKECNINRDDESI